MMYNYKLNGAEVGKLDSTNFLTTLFVSLFVAKYFYNLACAVRLL